MTANPRTRDLHERLRREHSEIDQSLEDVLRACETGDQEIVRQALRDAERRLTAHVQFEEEELLPIFRAIAADEAAHIEADHREFRVRMDEVAVKSDLHLIRLPALRSLIDAVRAHARREDETMYACLDLALTEEDEEAAKPAPPHGGP